MFNFKGDLWIPSRMRDSGRGQAGASDGATVVGRLRPGVSYEHAQSELDVLMRTFARDIPTRTAAWVSVSSRWEGSTKNRRVRPFRSCSSRSRWFWSWHARMSLISCWRAECHVTGSSPYVRRSVQAACASGVSCSSKPCCWRSRAERRAVCSRCSCSAGCAHLSRRVLLTTQPYIEEIGIDGITFGYTLIISLLTSVVFGLLPAWRATREQLTDGLRESASTGGSLGTRRLRTGLVVVEVALSTLLLIGAGLLVRSYSGVQHVNPGFDPAGVLTMTMTLPDDKYRETYQRRQFYNEAIDRLERLVVCAPLDSSTSCRSAPMIAARG